MTNEHILDDQRNKSRSDLEEIKNWQARGIKIKRYGDFHMPMISYETKDMMKRFCRFVENKTILNLEKSKIVEFRTEDPLRTRRILEGRKKNRAN